MSEHPVTSTPVTTGARRLLDGAGIATIAVRGSKNRSDVLVSAGHRWIGDGRIVVTGTPAPWSGLMVAPGESVEVVVMIDEFAPIEVGMSMKINGEEVSTGNGAACLGDPLNAVAWLAKTAIEQDIPHLGATLEMVERLRHHLLSPVVLASEQPLPGHIRQVVIAECDGAEASLLVPERPVEGLLLGAAGAGVGEPAPQVHLPGDERDQRNGAYSRRGLHELGDLLALAAEERLVLHRERQPQDELVEEEHDRVVPERLGVRRDCRQPGIEVEVGRLLCVGAEVRLYQCRDELLPHRRVRGCGACLVVLLLVPGARPQHRTPLIVRAVAAVAFFVGYLIGMRLAVIPLPGIL